MAAPHDRARQAPQHVPRNTSLGFGSHLQIRPTHAHTVRMPCDRVGLDMYGTPGGFLGGHPVMFSVPVDGGSSMGRPCPTKVQGSAMARRFVVHPAQVDVATGPRVWWPDGTMTTSVRSLHPSTFSQSFPAQVLRMGMGLQSTQGPSRVTRRATVLRSATAMTASNHASGPPIPRAAFLMQCSNASKPSREQWIPRAVPHRQVCALSPPEGCRPSPKRISEDSSPVPMNKRRRSIEAATPDAKFVESRANDATFAGGGSSAASVSLADNGNTQESSRHQRDQPGSTCMESEKLPGHTKDKVVAVTPQDACSPRSPKLPVNKAPMSEKLARRVAAEAPCFVDPLGYGQWTSVLDPGDPEERRLMVELLGRLYNRPDEGFYVNEVFGKRHADPLVMCDTYFEQLLTLARHRVAAFATRKAGKSDQFDVTFDTPDIYESVEGYFTPEFRVLSRFNGTGGGRKQSKGAPRDFVEGLHYFKSRRRAIDILHARERHNAKLKEAEVPNRAAMYQKAGQIVLQKCYEQPDPLPHVQPLSSSKF